MRMKLPALFILVLVIGGCSGKFDSSDPPTSSVLSGAEIRSILAGRSWRFTGPNNTGTTLYAEDGTSLVEVDGKGKTNGRWKAEEGQLCESFDPAPFLPSGVPMSCYAFSGSGGTYQVGKATFTLAG